MPSLFPQEEVSQQKPKRGTKVCSLSPFRQGTSFFFLEPVVESNFEGQFEGHIYLGLLKIGFWGGGFFCGSSRFEI